MNKEEKRAYSKAYRESHRIERKAYLEANKERIRAQQRAYREAHKKQIKAFNTAYRKANPKKVAECKKAYREANSEKVKASHIAYHKAKPEKKRESNRKQRALKYETRVEIITEKIIYVRDALVCQHCKKRMNKNLKWPHPMSPSLDHIVPLSQGGTHTYGNIQLAHLSCNLSKHNKVLPQGEQMRIF